MLLKKNALIYKKHPSRGWDEFKARTQAVVARAYSPRFSRGQQKTYPTFKDTVRLCLCSTDARGHLALVHGPHGSLPGEQGWQLCSTAESMCPARLEAPCDPSGPHGLDCRLFQGSPVHSAVTLVCKLFFAFPSKSLIITTDVTQTSRVHDPVCSHWDRNLEKTVDPWNTKLLGGLGWAVNHSASTKAGGGLVSTGVSIHTHGLIPLSQRSSP